MPLHQPVQQRQHHKARPLRVLCQVDLTQRLRDGHGLVLSEARHGLQRNQARAGFLEPAFVVETVAEELSDYRHWLFG